MHRLIFGGIRHVAHFDAAQVLDPAHTLHTGHHQAQGIAVFRAQHFAVLAVGHQHFAGGDQAHGDGAGHGRTITAFGQDELAVLQVGASNFKQGDEGHARELAARNHAVGVLHRGHGHIAPLHRRVGAALDEMKARHRGQTHDFVHGEHLGCFDHAVDHEAVLGRVDVPPPLVVPLKMQTAGRDDAKQRLQRRKRHRGLCGLRQARALTALHIRLEL